MPHQMLLPKKTLYIVLLFITAGALFLLLNKKDGKKSLRDSSTKIEEPEFIIEGSLNFKSAEDSILSTVAIEIADNNDERAQGLMHRRSMADNVGMLFIYSRSQPQSFWMKNTYISLDLIFADEDLKIVSIQRDAVPHSRNSIPSSKDAQYIVEVVGGYCNRNNIQEGDYIEFERL